MKKNEASMQLYTDGGSRGNGGPAAIGIVIVVDQEVIYQGGKYLGTMTNNQAEYKALQHGLNHVLYVLKNNVILHVFSDSELLVNQLNGIYKVKNEHLKILFDEVMILISKFQEIIFKHVERENKYIKIADRIVNQVLDKERK